jgi:hypothetical protein
MTHIPPFLRSRRALAAIAIVGVAAWLVAPDAVVRGLPFLLVLACPLMMVFMMGPMHQMPTDKAPHGNGDPYAPEALTRRLAELDAERVAISELLTAPRVDRTVRSSSAAVLATQPGRAKDS